MNYDYTVNGFRIIKSKRERSWSDLILGYDLISSVSYDYLEVESSLPLIQPCEIMRVNEALFFEQVKKKPDSISERICLELTVSDV